MASMGSPRQRVRLRRRGGLGGPATARPRRPLRAWQVAAGALAGIVGLSGLAIGAVALRLAMGPVVIDSEQVKRELGGLLGRSWGVGIAEVAIENAGWRPALRMSGVEIKNPEGLSVLQAPRVVVALDVGKLLVGSVRARSIAFSGLDLKVAVAKDGSLALTAGATSEPVKASPGSVKLKADAGEAERARGGPAALGVAAASLLELLTATDGLVGTLDEATIENARLTLVDDAGAPRFAFSDVKLGFQRPRDNVRHVSFELTGSKGRWAVEGTVARRGGGGRIAALKFNNVPVSDLLVLAGKSKSLATTDMPLSGVVRIASAPGGELASLDAEINGGSAVIHSTDPDMNPIDVDGVKLLTAWDPAFGAIVVKEASVRAGGTHIAVNGRLDASGPGGAWRLALTGGNAVMSPLTPTEKPIAVERIEFQMVGVDGGGALVERFEISGSDYGLGLTASLGTDADQGGMRIAVAGARSAARPVLRFWPSFAGRNVRDYLIAHLREGIVENFTVNMNVGADDLERSQAGQPLSDGVGKTEFALSNVELNFADGLPPLRKAIVTGSTTGRTAKVLVPQAVVPLAAGRSLGLSNGSLAVADTAQKRPPGIVNFRLAGGADAFVGLLGSESLRALAPVDIDPAAVKGNADLRVSVTLPLYAGIKMADIQVGAKGGLSGLGVDGLVGKDRTRKCQPCAIARRHDAVAQGRRQGRGTDHGDRAEATGSHRLRRGDHHDGARRSSSRQPQPVVRQAAYWPRVRQGDHAAGQSGKPWSTRRSGSRESEGRRFAAGLEQAGRETGTRGLFPQQPSGGRLATRGLRARWQRRAGEGECGAVSERRTRGGTAFLVQAVTGRRHARRA